MWGAVANLEYQSLDLTWLAGWPLTIALLTQVTVYWELFFCVLVWPRLLRPVILFLAVPLHLGIAFLMGMITFGLAMLIGCLSFVPPSLVRRVLGGASTEPGGAGQGGAARSPSRRKPRAPFVRPLAASAPGLSTRPAFFRVAAQLAPHSCYFFSDLSARHLVERAERRAAAVRYSHAASNRERYISFS